MFQALPIFMAMENVEEMKEIIGLREKRKTNQRYSKICG